MASSSVLNVCRNFLEKFEETSGVGDEDDSLLLYLLEGIGFTEETEFEDVFPELLLRADIHQLDTHVSSFVVEFEEMEEC